MARPTPSSALHAPLDWILGSQSLVRVVRALATHGGSLAVSDIARRARLTLPSTRDALKRLREAGIVSAVGADRSMVHALAPAHPIVQPLLDLFSAEQAQARAVIDAIRTAAARLSPAPHGVWLYGSVARKQDEPTSDIDVAIVTMADDPTPQADALRESLAAVETQQAHRVSVIGLGQADVLRLAAEGSGLWRDLERDAVILAGDAPTDVLEQLRRARAP